jgi:hypothetical protein
VTDALHDRRRQPALEQIIETVTKSTPSKTEVQQALSKVLNIDEDEKVFLLPREFVKGYVGRETGIIVANEFYNPYFLPEELSTN